MLVMVLNRAGFASWARNGLKCVCCFSTGVGEICIESQFHYRANCEWDGLAALCWCFVVVVGSFRKRRTGSGSRMLAWRCAGDYLALIRLLAERWCGCALCMP